MKQSLYTFKIGKAMSEIESKSKKSTLLALVIISLLVVSQFEVLAQHHKSDTVNHTYFTNRHHKVKSKYSLYLTFKMSHFLKPAYKVCFNPHSNKYDTIRLAEHDIIKDSLDPNHIFYYHELGQFVHLKNIPPQTVLLLDENHHIISIDILKAKEIKKLAEMYATPFPDDLRGYKVRYYKLTGIPIHGVGDVKPVEIDNPAIRMSCHDKKKHYRDNGINGQHAMIGY
jgi:hypothetical protein